MVAGASLLLVAASTKSRIASRRYATIPASPQSFTGPTTVAVGSKRPTTTYWRRVATCATPLELYDAGAQLMTDGLEIYSRAAAARLKGLGAPLLADA